MTQEGRAGAAACAESSIPTVAFQRCSTCGGEPRLSVGAIRAADAARMLPRGSCSTAWSSMPSTSGRRWPSTGSASASCGNGSGRCWPRAGPRPWSPPAATWPLCRACWRRSTGLTQADEPAASCACRQRFNLSRYQAHVQAHIRPIAISLEQIPPLSENRRLDRIWRFIAIIFLAHAGIVDVWQDGPNIMVMQRETDTERQGVPGDLEEADGIEGAVG